MYRGGLTNNALRSRPTVRGLWKAARYVPFCATFEMVDGTVPGKEPAPRLGLIEVCEGF